MTDNDIIKALECCKDRRCDICVRLDSGHNEECICRLELIDHSLDLINRQKAEIERLRAKVEKRTNEKLELGRFYSQKLKLAKSEAIKEFAERLKKSAFDCDVSFGYGREHYTEAVAVVEIDNLVKEITEDKNG